MLPAHPVPRRGDSGCSASALTKVILETSVHFLNMIHTLSLKSIVYIIQVRRKKPFLFIIEQTLHAIYFFSTLYGVWLFIWCLLFICPFFLLFFGLFLRTVPRTFSYFHSLSSITPCSTAVLTVTLRFLAFPVFCSLY